MLTDRHQLSSILLQIEWEATRAGNQVSLDSLCMEVNSEMNSEAPAP